MTQGPSGTSISIETIRTKIQEIIADQLKIKPAEVILGADLQNDLGVASLDAMEIILSIEEAFTVDIPDEAARQAKTAEDIAQFVYKKSSSHL